MKIAVLRQTTPSEKGVGRIATIRDYQDITGRGELAHVMAEWESIKLDLVDLWENGEFEEDADSVGVEY